MNEAFELSGPGSFLTCTFHVLFPAGVENLRCPGPGPTVEPGCGSRLPVPMSSGSQALPAGSLTLSQQPWKFAGKGRELEPSPNVAKGSNRKNVKEKFLQSVGMGLERKGAVSRGWC